MRRWGAQLRADGFPGALAAVDLFVSSHGAGTDSAGRAGSVAIVLAVVGSL